MADRKIVFTSGDANLKPGDVFKRDSANAVESYRVVKLLHVDKTGAAHYEGVVEPK